MIDREKLEEEIRIVAYEIYLKSGCIPNRDLDNWLEAERIVLDKYKEKEDKAISEEKKVKKSKSKSVKKKSSSEKNRSKIASKKKKK